MGATKAIFSFADGNKVSGEVVGSILLQILRFVKSIPDNIYDRGWIWGFSDWLLERPQSLLFSPLGTKFAIPLPRDCLWCSDVLWSSNQKTAKCIWKRCKRMPQSTQGILAVLLSIFRDKSSESPRWIFQMAKLRLRDRLQFINDVQRALLNI